MSDDSSRRSFMKAAGAATALAAGAGAVVNTTVAVDGDDGGWTEQEAPTGKTLSEVVDTVEGPYAVGSSGNILTRNDGAWELVVDSGPSTKNNGLNDVAVTDDGKRIWYNGGSGALGAYDVESGEKTNYTAPKGKTSTWEAIGVYGTMDNEIVLPANGSGEVFPGQMNEKGCIEWEQVTKPGGGSTIPGVTFREDENGNPVAYVIDTSQGVYRCTDNPDDWKGQDWTQIGVQNAQVAFYDVIATEDTVLVAGGSGRLYRLDCICQRWTPIDVGSKSLNSLSMENNRVLAAASSGRVYRRGSEGWQQMDASSTQADLLGIAHGDNYNVAVGSSGTVITNTPEDDSGSTNTTNSDGTQ
jgi:hypothetical protein